MSKSVDSFTRKGVDWRPHCSSDAFREIRVVKLGMPRVFMRRKRSVLHVLLCSAWSGQWVERNKTRTEKTNYRRVTKGQMEILRKTKTDMSFETTQYLYHLVFFVFIPFHFENIMCLRMGNILRCSPCFYHESIKAHQWLFINQKYLTYTNLNFEQLHTYGISRRHRCLPEFLVHLLKAWKDRSSERQTSVVSPPLWAIVNCFI